MKNMIFIKVASYIIFVILLHQITPASAQPTQDQKESMVFEKLTHDYGMIKQGSDGYCEFKFTNKGSTPLVLNDVRASCGCTAPEWPKEPIAPGKTGVIKVKYNTNIMGAFNKSIMIQSNAINSQVVLRVQGTVVASQ
jgi:hypothetical protein